MTVSFSCPDVLRIIVVHNPEDQKAFLLNLEMNVMKFITLEIVPGVKSSPQSVMSIPWNGAWIRMGLFTIRGRHNCCAPFRDLKKTGHLSDMWACFLSMPSVSIVFLMTLIFSSPFLQMEVTVPSGLRV